jgi:predicted homoserine dehydrogenase-like protein
VAAADIRIPDAERATHLYKEALARDTPRVHSAPSQDPVVTNDLRPLISAGRSSCDVLIECTDTVAFGASLAEATLRSGIDVVLMNAEVDYLLGSYLRRVAKESGSVVSSDAGDQHGVLARMIDEARMWGFTIVLAGNIKGFLDRYATPESIANEARSRNLSPHMCAAFTDGTKLNIEMALVANAASLRPIIQGMTGPRINNVSEVMQVFDFDTIQEFGGAVDYIIGAQPGGGVFLVVYSDEPIQRSYLNYYKLGTGPYYLLYRPYHLCHLETPFAIGSVVLHRRAVLQHHLPRSTEVIAVAKRDITAGTVISRGIGSDLLYGVIEGKVGVNELRGIPICLFDQLPDHPVAVRRSIERDLPVTWDDVSIPDTQLTRCYLSQEALEIA